MPWKIKLGDESMLIDRLSIDDLSKVCGSRDSDGIPKYPFLNWMQLRNSPATEPEAFYDLVCTVARRLELAVPDRPTDVGGYVDFVNDHIDFMTADDLPTQFSDGALPLGEADNPETITSSTSTENGDGTPTEPGEPA